ncbi:hypothetical protein SALBM311S_10035 [Streptomyces alboniger]
MYRSGEELYERIPHVVRADPTLSEHKSGSPAETDVAKPPSPVRSLRGKGVNPLQAFPSPGTDGCRAKVTAAEHSATGRS